jgi:sugar lactone lactonase YvrE
MAGGRPATTSLKRVDLDGTVTLVADELAFPNGMVITPDGLNLYVGETAASRYTAFAIGDDGRPAPAARALSAGPEPPLGSFGEMIAALGCAPDGCCLDAEGTSGRLTRSGGAVCGSRRRVTSSTRCARRTAPA